MSVSRRLRKPASKGSPWGRGAQAGARTALTSRTRVDHDDFAAGEPTNRRLDRGVPLSVPELAVLAHLPTDEADPGLQRAGTEAMPPPPGIPTTGDQVRPIGRSDSGYRRSVGLNVADARHHLHILGATRVKQVRVDGPDESMQMQTPAAESS